jgi:hypothetical protein
MGVRIRWLDIKAGAAKLKADRAARLEAELVVDRWNRRLATGRDMLWSPTVRAAQLAGTPWLDVFVSTSPKTGVSHEYGRHRWLGFELQAHSIELSPHGDAVVIGVTEGHVKFRRQINNIRQQQPNARGREISHRTSDKGILLEQDHTLLGALVPRGQSPFNASIH